jgi:hypothetical protein
MTSLITDTFSLICSYWVTLIEFLNLLFYSFGNYFVNSKYSEEYVTDERARFRDLLTVYVHTVASVLT